MLPGLRSLRTPVTLLFLSLLVVPARAESPRLELFARAAAPAGTAMLPVVTRGARFARLQAPAVERLRSVATARVALPTADGDLVLDLERSEAFSPRATVTATGDAGPHAFTPEVTCLRGKVEGDPASLAVLTLGSGGAMGFVETRGRRWAIAPVAGGLQRIADEAGLPAPGPAPRCGVRDDPAPDGKEPGRATLAAPSPDRYVCDLAVDCDYEFYGKFGNDVALATQYATTVVATISLIYERDLNTSIRLAYLNVWTTSADPYNVTSASGAKDEFNYWWGVNRRSVARTIAFLISGKTFSGGFSGISSLDVLCASPINGFGYAVASVLANGVLPNNVTTRDVWLIAHEIGHEFGSWHTQSCNWSTMGYIAAGALLDSCYAQEGSCYVGPTGILPPDKGTMMSYCDQLPNGGGAVSNTRLVFHPVCAARMRSRVEASCMTPIVYQPPRHLAASVSGTATRLAWEASPISDVFRYDVYRSTWQNDLAPQLIGSTTGTTFDDPAPPWADFAYRVRGMTAAGPTGWSNEVVFDRCPMEETGRYPAGVHPLTTAPADYNGDGHLDIAVVNSGVGFSVLLGDGAGHLGAPTAYNDGVNPINLARADFNGDGISDLALDFYGSNQIALYSGNGAAGVGNGTFAPPVYLTTLAGPQGLVTADFNEDGIADLALAQVVAGAVSIYLGQGAGGVGDGTFAPPVHVALPGAREIVATEVNGDGITDLVVLPTSGPKVLLGNGSGGKGDGTFTLGGSSTANGPAVGIAAGDLNADDIVDLVVGSLRDQPQVSTFTTFFGSGTGGVGDGTFGSRHDYVTAPWAVGVTIDDWTQDGIPDVGVAPDYPIHGGLIYPGLGGGVLGGSTWLDSGDDARILTSGDFDEDGLPDVAISNVNLNTISIFRHTCPRELANGAALTAPNGGETMAVDDERTIAWTRDPGCLSVTIEISRDGGARWKPIARNVVGTSYRWTVTGPPTTQARIRVANATVASAGDASDADFIITGALVATELALAGREIGPHRVALTWQGVAAATLGAVVERRGADSAWQVVGDAERVADDRVRVVDESVTPGERYAYRLAWFEDGMRNTTAEEWIDVPAAADFALEGLRPNPAAGAIQASLSLPSGAPASLELLDLAGRRVAGRDVGSLGAGHHLVPLDPDGPIPAGVYWLRLRQGAREEMKRAVVMR